MESRYEIRTIRIDDWIAESLENEANRIPPSHKEQADSLRRQAQIYRGSANPKTIQVWVELPPTFQTTVKRG
jgi:hypothetical protein